MKTPFGPRRAIYLDVTEELKHLEAPLDGEELENYESFDLIYRALCSALYNFVPLSGHPGGSISSGRIVLMLLYEAMDYDVSDPDRSDADIISYAAGHKALGLYAMWAMRNEILRISAPHLLPGDLKWQLRLEDLLGFRRNQIAETPLFMEFKAKALDGHPTPLTPMVRLSTGASGVGLAASIGLAIAAMDYYGRKAPLVHIIEGEGGMTPGRVNEVLAAAGTASLRNAVLHIDWNQASIDSNHVCRSENKPGDYVQWDPCELAYLHDWNVIFVPDGKDFQQISAAQRILARMQNSQPTAIVYRTVKGWQYGIEGSKSHGAGHALCSDGFLASVQNLLEESGSLFPTCKNEEQRCKSGKLADVLEECFWRALSVVRQSMEKRRSMTDTLANKLENARQRLRSAQRTAASSIPSVDTIYAMAQNGVSAAPPELLVSPGKLTTLRGELGRALNYYNKSSNGAIFVASADLLGSTNVAAAGSGFSEGYFNADTNPRSRMLAIGGICEDAQSGVMAGLTAFGRHIGVDSSYAAFMAPLGHIAGRLHAIGCEARKALTGEPFKPLILVCAHAGIKTGEDGPTHADPQPLQLVQENFPQGTAITLTPWDPQEIWILLAAALSKRPALIFPFVTRPKETVLDRNALGIAPVEAAAKGIYLLHRSDGKRKGCVVLQGSEVAYEFITQTLPLLHAQGTDIDAYYVASAELFDLLPREEQESIFPEECAKRALGITGFTLPTLYRWVTSELGRRMSLHPFKKDRFLGSGNFESVLKEGELDGRSQCEAIMHLLRNSFSIFALFAVQQFMFLLESSIILG